MTTSDAIIAQKGDQSAQPQNPLIGIMMMKNTDFENISHLLVLGLLLRTSIPIVTVERNIHPVSDPLMGT
jgi:hypothetical protein